MSNNYKTSIITFASGKGGVGKTSISLNFALSLIKQGHSACILDADLGLANIDILLGLSPEYSLIDYIEGRNSFDDIVVQGPLSMKIIPGGSALDKIPELNGDHKKRLSKIPHYLQDIDTLIIDASAGISDLVLFFMEASGIPTLVITPEPTSITDAYSLLKKYNLGGNKGPVFIMINQVDSAEQARKVYHKFGRAVDRHLDIKIKSMGYVLKDRMVSSAISKQTPFVILSKDSPASVCLRSITKAYISSDFNSMETDALGRLFYKEEQAIINEPEPIVKGDLPSDSDDQRDASENFGEIVALLIKEDLITTAQADYADKVRKKLDNPRTLLDTLKDLGYIRENQIRETLFKNRTNFRLGSLMVELGYITEKQLSTALNEQKKNKTKKRLGEILIESNYITELELTQVLSLTLGIPYIEPTMDMLDMASLEMASPHFFYSHKILPIKSEDDRLNIIMADPLDSDTLHEIKNLFGREYTTSISMGKYIDELLGRYNSLKNHKKQIENNESEIVRIVDSLINDALEKQASDIHIEPLKNRVRVRLRRDGSLIQHSDLPKDLESAIISRIKIMASANITERRRHQDGRILMNTSKAGEEIDIRASFYVTVFGEKVVMRILNKKAELYKIEDLGMGPKMLERFREDVLELPSGVVIITGPTGAGKTTTLYASINYCNKIDTNIITAEDPVEYIIDGISQCTINQKIGVTFEETLRHMLRQDPDIMILGEIRDRFSAESAIQAALTGHKVLTTFHTEDSIGGLLRLMNMDIETFLISSTVVCVVAQRLLKKVCPFCGKDYTPTARDLRRLKYQSNDIRGYNFQTGTGCSHCDYTGYRGRVGVFEMLVLNEYVKEAILNRKTSYEIRRTSIETTGLITLMEDGLAKAAKGITTIEEVLRQLPALEAPRPISQIYRLTGDI